MKWSIAWLAWTIVLIAFVSPEGGTGDATEAFAFMLAALTMSGITVGNPVGHLHGLEEVPPALRGASWLEVWTGRDCGRGHRAGAQEDVQREA